jgi:diadenosine tetraphosphate (Ap4A) HIT family hydrolase
MLVIPPSPLDGQVEYFNALAETTWEEVCKKNPEAEVSVKKEFQTLVITCKVEIENKMVSPFHLHYRYFKERLYCFIVEDEPVESTLNK